MAIERAEHVIQRPGLYYLTSSGIMYSLSDSISFPEIQRPTADVVKALCLYAAEQINEQMIQGIHTPGLG